jgi:hypothetical protein
MLVGFARALPRSQGVFSARALLESSRGNYRADQAAVELRKVPSSGLADQASGTAILAGLDQVRGKLSRATRDFRPFAARSPVD